MNQKVKTFLFALGIMVSVVLINAIILASVVRPAYLGYSIGFLGLILVTLGKYMWAILPASIFLTLIIKENVTNRRTSETQKALKRGSIWAFIIMAGFMLLDSLSSIS